MIMERIRRGASLTSAIVALIVLSLIAVAIVLTFVSVIPVTVALMLHFEESVAVKENIVSLTIILAFIITVLLTPRISKMNDKNVIVFILCLTVLTAISLIK